MVLCMNKTINSDLMRGNINTIILKSLYNGDRYGYDIIREIKEKSRGQYILKQPTLYSCLKRLENQGFIRGCWGEESNGGRRKYYTLTDLGREVFIKSQDEYEYSRTIIDQLISERDYDLDSVERPIDEDDEMLDELVEEKTDRQTANNEESAPTAPLSPEIKRDDSIVVSSNTDGEILTTTTPSINFDELFGETVSTSYSINAETEPATIDDAYTIPAETYDFSEFVEEKTDIVATTQVETQTPTQTAIAHEPQTEINDQQSEQITPQATVEFRSYQSPSNIQQSAPATTRTTANNSTSITYRNTLSELIDGFNNQGRQQAQTTQEATQEPIQPTQPTQPKLDEIKAKSDLSVKEKIQVKNFGRLTESIREMGDSVKIRTKNSNAIAEYNNKYYYYKNKLALYQYGIMFLIMILETFLAFVIVKRGCGINTPGDTTFYILSILFCLAFPVYAGLSYLFNPTAKKRLEFNFTATLIFRIIIALQCILITYALCVFFNMPIGGQADYALYLTIPILLSTNIPLSAVVFKFLYKSKKFAV